MAYYYCEKCGNLIESRTAIVNCQNTDCLNSQSSVDMYQIDDLFVELITGLHSRGIPTTGCCSGHIHNVTELINPYVAFKVDNIHEDYVRELFIPEMNNLISEEYVFSVVPHNKEGGTFIVKLGVVRRDESYIKNSLTLTLLTHINNFYKFLHMQQVTTDLDLLTTTQSKRDYGTYNAAGGIHDPITR